MKSRKSKPALALATQPTEAEESIFGEIEELATPIGFLEVVTPSLIRGWAWDPDEPDEPIVVEVLDGADVVCSVLADRHRADLERQGVGNGRHGFEIPNPSPLFPLARHTVSVRRAADKVGIAGSPAPLLQPGVGIDSAVMQLLMAAAESSANAAKSADEVDLQIQLSLRVLNQLLNTRQALEGRPLNVADMRLQQMLAEAEVSDWMRELFFKLESDYAPLSIERVEAPLVSVIIPVYGKFQVTYNCIKSITENLPKASFEVIIVDDCSKDETLIAGLNGLVFSGGIQMIRNDKNAGFVRSCNNGAARARGDYLFFLNNDTLVRPGWLDELVQTFENVPNVGIAGSKLFFEDGQQQEVGGIIWRMGDGWNWGRLGDSKDPRFCFLRDADYVSGAALMIKRDTFESLRGFDELYVPAYYEDTDLCFRVRAMGKRVVVQPASEIVHLEGISAGTDVRGSGMKRYQLINHRKFFERWKDVLAGHRFNAEQPELEAERTVKKRAYFIDDSVPTPDQDAGSNAAIQHMLALMRLGYKVTFIPADNMARIDPYTAKLEKIGIECYFAPYYWSVEEVFRKTQLKPDLVYLHRYTNASKYANMVRQHFPKAKILYNVADLHFLRQQRELEVEGSLHGVAEISEAAEMAAMRAVDAVIVHSTVEQALLKSKDPGLKVYNVPWTIKMRATTLPFAKRAGFAFVGGYGHRPNVDAALHLANEIMPAMRARGSSIQCYLIGAKAPPEVKALESGDIRVLGFVPELSSTLHHLRFTMAPLRYGAGLKGKVLDSFAHGLPCLMSETAAEGMDLPDSLQWLVARGAQEFAEKAAALDTDAQLNARLSAAGLDFLASGFSEDAVQALIASAVSG